MRARVGVLITENALLYATGGVAIGAFNPSPQAPGSIDARWTVGSGLEIMFTPEISWRVETLHIGDGRESEIVRTGVAIHF